MSPFIRDTVTAFSTRMIAIGLGLAAASVIARHLGPGGQGAYSFVVLISTLLALVSNLGLGIANVYFGGTKRYTFEELASNSLVAAYLIGVPLASAFLLYYFAVHPSFLKDVAPLVVVLAAFVVPSNLLVLYFSHILLAQKRIAEFNYLTLAQSGVAFIFVFALLVVSGAGLVGAILAWTGGVVVSAWLAVRFVRKVTALRWSFSPSLFSASAKFGIQGYMGSIVAFLYYRLDMFLVALFLNMTAVGYYSVGVAVAESLWIFPATVGSLIFARTAASSWEEANARTPRICRNTFFLTLLAGGVLFVVSKPLILLVFGSRFLPALVPLRFLLPGTLILCFDKVLGNEITGRGKPLVGTAIATLSLSIAIPLYLIFIPRMGIAGAALASTVSYSATAVMTLLTFLRMAHIGWLEVILPTREDMGIYASVLARSRTWVVEKIAFDK